MASLEKTVLYMSVLITVLSMGHANVKLENVNAMKDFMERIAL
jgi:hypothetical protein